MHGQWKDEMVRLKGLETVKVGMRNSARDIPQLADISDLTGFTSKKSCCMKLTPPSASAWGFSLVARRYARPV